jgi:hypothetical protein
MTTGSKILLGVAAAVSAAVVINYLMHTEKGSEVSRQVKDVAGDLLNKGKEMLSKAKEEAEGRLNEKLV